MYYPPIKGQPKKIQSQPTGRDFVESVVGVQQLAQEMTGLKNDLVGQVNSKIKEVDNTLQTGIDKINNASKILENTKSEAISLIQNIKQGEPGKDADEEDIVSRVTENLTSQLPDVEKLKQDILSEIPEAPKFDIKSITKSVLKAIPENKASLKAIQEKIDIDPMSVIEKIMSLPEGKFKLKTANIDGLEQTMSAFRSQLGRGYLHGGGDTVVAGSGIIITNNSNGTKTISSNGNTVWGTITGTLSSQTDLQTALNAKFNNPSGTSSQFVKGNGSLDSSTYLTAVPAGYLQNSVGISGGTTLIGGTGVTDSLTLQSTSGVGATGAIINFKVGNNGATTAMTILNNGNVGIGTTSPTSLFSVGSTSQFQVNSSGAIAAMTGETNSGNISLIAASPVIDSTTGTLSINTTTNKPVTFGTGLASFGGALTVTGNTQLTGTTGIGAAAVAGTILNVATKVLSGTNAYGLQVTAPSGATNNYAASFMGGNVGIGTTSPSSPLQVQSPSSTGRNALFTTNDYNGTSTGTSLAISFGATSGNTASYISAFNSGSTAYGSLILNSGGGNVGIGTTGPGAKLDINTGGLLVEDTTTNLGSVSVSSNARQLLITGQPGAGASGAPLYINPATSGGAGRLLAAFGINGTNYFTTDVSGNTYIAGNVGIGTTSPGSKLTVTSGDIEIKTNTTGIIMHDTTNSTLCYRIQITSGLVVPTSISCP